MKTLLRVALGAVFLPAGLAFADEASLRRIDSPHFIVYYESSYPPAGLLNDLEGLHVKLLMDLNDFVPWASEEKITVTVFSDPQSYKRNTGVMEWAGGHVLLAERKIFVYESDNFRRVMAHEMAHLFLEDFFARKKSKAPSWLTEGVATTMEWDYGLEASRPLEQARFLDEMEPLEDFLRFDYHQHARPAESISLWYRQAYSLVRFMMRRFSPVQFFHFCGHVADGKTVDQSLALAYGVQMWDVPSLEKIWREHVQGQPG